MGYAVNKIFLPAEHLQLRTTSGHGLRETLFYRLFGKLQVYKSREHLYMASSCIEDGAVSLDGGMMRGNGVVSVGFGCVRLFHQCLIVVSFKSYYFSLYNQ